MRNLVVAIILVISFLIVINILNTSDESSSIEGQIGVQVDYNNWGITINDAYIATVEMPEGLAYEFDKYIAFNIEITNLSENTEKFSTLGGTFGVYDRNKVTIKPVFDENLKKYSSDISPGESWTIDLVFPVDSSEYYTLTYTAGKRNSQKDVISWKIYESEMVEKQVPLTKEHAVPSEDESHGGGE